MAVKVLFLLTSALVFCVLEALTAVRPRVCVVGGGIAGIITARELAKLNKVDVVLLEAQDRLGGRAWSVNMSGVSIDMGAQWIHGATGHPFMAAAAKLGAKTYIDDEPYRYIKANGLPFTDQEITRLYKDWSKIMARVSYYQDVGQRDRPLSAGLQQAWRDVGSNLQVLRNRSSPVVQSLFDWLVETEIESEYATVASNLSLWYYDSDAPLKGPERLVTIGIGNLLMRGFPLPETVDVFYGVRVKNVDIRTKNKIRLTSATNEVFVCDGAVITVSLGVMKSGFINFTPKLPLATTRALSRRVPGSADKFVLEFASRWWPSENAFFKADVSQSFNEFYDHTRIVGRPILVSIVADEIEVAEYSNLPDAQVVELIMQALRNTFPGRNVSDPIAYRAARWTSNPLYFGAWSSNAVGFNPSIDFPSIRRSGSKRLIFAGEHTDNRHFGTIWGAHSSGIRAAREIIKVV